MAEHLSAQEHGELSKALETGEAKLSFTRTFARQFYLRVGAQSISKETGQSALGQKLLIVSMLSASVLLIVASLALIIEHFGWGSMFGVALLGIFWTILTGFTTELGDALYSIVLLVATLAAAYFLPIQYSLPALFFGLSVFLFRTAHMLAFYFLYRLLGHSVDAYNQLYEQINVERF